MEYGLRVDKYPNACLYRIRLNPCFNGIWSASPKKEAPRLPLDFVLILVLMEYGLRE